MAAEKPGSVQQDESPVDEIEARLLSMESIDRASPELWPEKFPGMNEFINNYVSSSSNKLPYSKEFNSDDNNQVCELATLSTTALISKVKELHDTAYRLGVEESKEMTRGKYLSIFSGSSSSNEK